MIAISVKELVDKLNRFAKNNPNYLLSKEEMVIDAYVAGPRDTQYPEGTVVFVVTENNLKVPENVAIHELTIYPDKIGVLN